MSFDPVQFLIVDDLEENLVALEAVLRSDDVVVVKARSGNEALELLLTQEVALALVDVHMPGMDGFELADLIHGNLRTRGIPIIFLTAGTQDAQRYKGYEAGAVDFLHKPIEPDVLKSKASVFFELHRRRQEIAKQRDELALATREAQQYAAALQVADKRKDEFLATLAHELRTPLAPIRNGLEILRRQPVGAAAEQAKETMDRQLSHMVQLIDDLLDVSRVSTGKIVLRKKCTDLHVSIRSAIESAQPLIDQSKHMLRVDVAAAPLWVEADSTRLDQIIANLLINAAKYTPQGGRITVKAHHENDVAVVSISDTGVGIPSEMLSRIFELFTQGDTQVDGADKGLGIGLALVKHLVSMHNGTITVDSAGQSCGSTFTIRLPLSTAPVPIEQPQLAPIAEAPAALHILIVDDNVDSAHTTGWLLEMMGHRCSLAHDGPQALVAAKAEPVHAIFLDIGLPGIDGYEVCRRLRQDPAFADTLIVAQTGWGQDRDREMAREAGFSHHLVKPLRLDDITALLAAVTP